MGQQKRWIEYGMDTGRIERGETMRMKPLLLKIYDAASMQRWNDQIPFVEFTELDKQAHKMIIAYVLAKCEEKESTKELDWIEIIEAGIFEFFQRTVLTDIKPPLFHKIKGDAEKYSRLNEWIYEKMEPILLCLGKEFCDRFKNYLNDKERNVNRRIISAAHFYATKWEFNIIEGSNPQGYLIDEIRQDIDSKQKAYSDLKSMQVLINSTSLRDFINICGQLRFQIRWSHLHRVPETSVLGHMLIVAMVAYLFSLYIKTDRETLRNNYFTGLFHDLPEVLTRDIINPVKKSIEGLEDLIKEYEKEAMGKKIYRLIPNEWHSEMKFFTEDEFSNTKTRYGEMIKGVDQLAAFIEAYLSLENGIKSKDLIDAKNLIMREYKDRTISGIDFDKIYRQFVEQ